MTFAVARPVGESRHRVAAICEHYVEQAFSNTNMSVVRRLSIDETSRACGHDYITVAAEPPSGALWRRPRCGVSSWLVD